VVSIILTDNIVFTGFRNIPINNAYWY